MQAEVTGKLKQHFNNTLPRQNNPTAGVSVIMVSKYIFVINYSLTYQPFNPQKIE